GVRVYPSEANFIMIELTEKPPAEVFNGLLAGGILIRNISSYPGLARCLRITVGQPADNRAFIRALREVME
ncbi:MAG: histidinol-phosphate aminotransferase, partial [Gemmatimonadota bacterium]|nr:histidinol-phosphate aminotransferase [Gemmatimonadota bacterium]